MSRQPWIFIQTKFATFSLLSSPRVAMLHICDSSHSRDSKQSPKSIKRINTFPPSPFWMKLYCGNPRYLPTFNVPLHPIFFTYRKAHHLAFGQLAELQNNQKQPKNRHISAGTLELFLKSCCGGPKLLHSPYLPFISSHPHPGWSRCTSLTHQAPIRTPK